MRLEDQRRPVAVADRGRSAWSARSDRMRSVTGSLLGDELGPDRVGGEADGGEEQNSEDDDEHGVRP